MKRLFVYGTLMKGFGLNDILKSMNAKFISKGIIEGFELYANFIPYLIRGEGIVKGEVYELNNNDFNANINHLDIIEGGYKRTLIKVKMDDKIIEAYAYIFKHFDENRNFFVKINDGDYRKWRTQNEI